ncbi:hypothetical protein ACP4OV_006396 [Aristida adscensionis]
MCTLAPFLLPGLAAVAPHAAPAGVALPPRPAMFAQDPGTLCGYDDDDTTDIDALLRDIDAVVHHQPTRAAAPAPPPVAAAGAGGAGLQYRDFDFNALLAGVRSVHVPSAGLAPVDVADDHDDATPTTPVAELSAPLSYGDDDDEDATIDKTPAKPKKLSSEPCEPYVDVGDLDASLRAMEKDPAEQPSAAYLWTTQAGTEMTAASRAELVGWMHALSGYYALAAGTLHRAVSYVDRFLSRTKIGGARQLRLLGAVAVFAAAKYEDRKTTWKLDADVFARHAGCTRGQVLDAERELVEALRYRLSGPTAYTFVELFTRHVDGGGEGSAVRSLAHHLADLALLDYRCVAFLPSAVAAAAVALAAAWSWRQELELIKGTGYTVEELAGIMDAIYEMHRFKDVWPGCASAQMMPDCGYSCSWPSC